VSVWLSIEDVVGLGYARPTLFRHLAKLTTRPGPKSANGKPRREISLESLPLEIQARFYKRQKESALDASGAEGENNASAALAAAMPLHQPLAAALSPINLLAELSEDELAELTELAEQVKKAKGKSHKEKIWHAKKLGVHVATLCRWIKAFDAEGLAGLLRKQRQDRGRSRVADDQVIAKIQADYLNPYKPTARQVYRAIARDYALSALKPPSYTFVRRAIDAIDPDLVAKLRDGERRFDDKFAYISLRKKPDRPRLWADADHHPCDHYVVFPNGDIGRPWLTAIQDLCTNEILGFHITREKKTTYPGAVAIGLVIRQAVLKKDDARWPSFGIFDHFYHDLGKDFRSAHVRAICAELHIDVVPTRGYHGKSKPIERWFGIVEDQTRHLPGYCGNKPDNNPERQKLKPEALDPKKLLTVDQYADAIKNWILNDFHHASSRALNGLSPLEALGAHARNGFVAREVRDERVLDLVLMRRKGAPAKVHNFGIQVFNRYFMAPELVPLIGQAVDICWDPERIGEILCYQGNRFVCKAGNKELLEFGADEEMLKREKELKRDQKRDVEARYQQLLMRAQYPNPMARAAAESRMEKVLGEERRKIAVNAEPEGVPVLLPKFQQAAKQLAAPTARSGAKLRRAGAGSAVAPLAEQTPRSKQPWEVDDALPTAADIFKREEKAEWEKELEDE